MRVDIDTPKWGLVVEMMCVIIAPMFKRSIIFMVIAGLVVGMLGLFFLARDTQQLTGVVYDAATNAPIPGAHIFADNNSSATDAQGHYVMPIPRGKLTLSAKPMATMLQPHRSTANNSRRARSPLILSCNRIAY